MNIKMYLKYDLIKSRSNLYYVPNPRACFVSGSICYWCDISMYTNFKKSLF